MQNAQVANKTENISLSLAISGKRHYNEFVEYDKISEEMMKYLAHIAEDGRKQSVEAHLLGTAKLAKQFAKSFGAGSDAAFAGLLHDIGKCTGRLSGPAAWRRAGRSCYRRGEGCLSKGKPSCRFCGRRTSWRASRWRKSPGRTGGSNSLRACAARWLI